MRSVPFWLLAVPLVALGLPGCFTSTGLANEDVQVLIEERLLAYDDALASQAGQLTSLAEQVDALEAELATLSSTCITPDNLGDYLEDVDTSGFLTVESADALFLTPTEGDAAYASVATAADLDARVSAIEADYLLVADYDALASAVAEVAAVETILDDRLSAIEADYLTTSSLSGYAMSAELSGYATSADLADYATSGDLDAVDDRVAAVEADYVVAGDLAPYAPLADLDGVDARLAAVEAEYVVAGDLAAYATHADLDGAEARLAAVEADYVTEAALDAVADDAASDLSDLSDDTVHLIETDTTYSVSTAAGLTSALADLDGYRIASGATVTIELAAGTYNFSDALQVAHADGARIAIVGDTSDPSKVVLRFPSSGGVLVRHNDALGYLGGVTVEGGSSGYGVGAKDGGLIALGPIVATAFEVGAGAQMGGLLLASDEIADASYPDGWIEVYDNDAGVSSKQGGIAFVRSLHAHDNSAEGALALWSSFLDAEGATIEDNAAGARGYYGSAMSLAEVSVTGNTDMGVQLQDNSYGYLDGSSLTGNGYGLYLPTAAVASANNTTISSNTNTGLFAYMGSVVSAGEVEATSNGGHGIYSESMSMVHAPSAAVTGNGSHGVYSNYGSAATVNSASISGNGGYQIDASYGGIVSAFSASISPSNDVYESSSEISYIWGN